MNNQRIKLFLAYVIALMPVNKVRCFLYCKLLRYKIHESYLGWGSVFSVNYAELIGCSIGKRNKFIGPMCIIIKKDTHIGQENMFICGWWTREEQFKLANFNPYLEIGEKTLITSNHYFDIAGSFILGNYSWISGIGSQFWTHGAGVKDRNVTIGDHCYLGSAVRFAPGSSIGNNCIVALGSIVVEKKTVNNAMIAGCPAKVIRENYDWKTRKDIC